MLECLILRTENLVIWYNKKQECAIREIYMYVETYCPVWGIQLKHRYESMNRKKELRI